MNIPIAFYDNYRVFLCDYYEWHKKNSVCFSFRYFAQKAGLTSPSHFREVMNGKRKLTAKTLPLFIKGLGLKEHEALYFKLLVQFNQSQNPREKQKFLDSLLELKHKECNPAQPECNMKGCIASKNICGRSVCLQNKQLKTVIPLDHFDYYAQWYNVVIRELACTFNWHDDYALLAKSVIPPIKKSQARESVAFLVQKGFLKKNSDGTYVQTNPLITSGAELNSLAIRTYNKKMTQLAEYALDQFSGEERDIQSMTVGVSSKGYALMKKEIKYFLDRIAHIAIDDTQSDQVYNVNVHIFPLSKRCSRSNDDT